MTDSNPALQGIEITVPELLRARPDKKLTGFAPSGRVTTHQWGVNRSLFLGLGMEFAESRLYQPGDDVRNIDWRVTARTGQTHTKLFQEERERPVHILLDLSAGMHFGTRTRFKSHLAAEIAAQLAWVGFDGGDRVSGLITHNGRREYFKASRSRRSLLRFLHGIAEHTRPTTSTGQSGDLSADIKALRQEIKSSGLVFIVSDFSTLTSDTLRELKRLAVRSHVTLIQVSDPFDARLPAHRGRITDGSAMLSLNAIRRQAIEDYQSNFVYRKESLSRLCRQHNMAFQSIFTFEDPKQLLYPDNHSGKGDTL